MKRLLLLLILFAIFFNVVGCSKVQAPNDSTTAPSSEVIAPTPSSEVTNPTIEPSSEVTTPASSPEVTNPTIEPSSEAENPPVQITAIWPTTGSLVSADVHDCFGPRLLPSGYDFHAGIDIKGSMGSPIYSALSGEVVDIDYYTGTESHGNAITVKHSEGVYTSYLHLSSIEVTLHQQIEIGQEIGKMGNTGANSTHLHFGYFSGMPSDNRSEKYSKNPLEILPHSTAFPISITIAGTNVCVDLNNDEMTINKWEFSDGAVLSRTINYYDIVKEGSVDRNNQNQNGVYITVTDPVQNIFTLIFTLDFNVLSVKGYDFNNNLIIEKDI